jgi:hypothetical protein
LSINTGTPVADPLIPPTTMEDLNKYLDSEVLDPDPSNLTFQPSDHMLITLGTGSQPAPPKVKQPESWPLLRPGGQEIAPPKPRSAESEQDNLASQNRRCHTNLGHFRENRHQAYSWASWW